MDVVMGKVPSRIDPNFRPWDLAVYWKRKLEGASPLGDSGASSNAFGSCETLNELPQSVNISVDMLQLAQLESSADRSQKTWKQRAQSYIGDVKSVICNQIDDVFWFVTDVTKELFMTGRSFFWCVTGVRDPVRQTPNWIKMVLFEC
jgi:hypothetical protein